MLCCTVLVSLGDQSIAMVSYAGGALRLDGMAKKVRATLFIVSMDLKRRTLNDGAQRSRWSKFAARQLVLKGLPLSSLFESAL